MIKLPIVLTCDDKYFKYASVVIASIVANRKRTVSYEINILSEYISPENKERALAWIKKYKNVELKFIELQDFDASQFYLNSYMTASTYYRFYIPQIFKDYERVLYLDCDLVVDADISDLATIDLGEKLMVCCICPYITEKISQVNDPEFPRSYFEKTLRMSDPMDYFNAGVMLCNIRRMNEINITEKLLEALIRIKEPLLQDQDILNSVVANWGGTKTLIYKYNTIAPPNYSRLRGVYNRLLRFFGLKEYQFCYIHHYTGGLKPWQNKGRSAPLFDYYAKRSPFYEDIVEENRLGSK